MEAELELEKQRSLSEEAQKTRELELEEIVLDVEVKALEKEDPDSSQERLKDFEDAETIPASHKQENDKEIKPDEVPENPMTSDVAYMSTSTPKPGTKYQQSNITFQDKEEASNKRLHVETPANTIVLRPTFSQRGQFPLPSLFRCFGRHWANKCRFNKQCGVNCCTRLYNELLHRIMEEDNSIRVPTPEEPPMKPSHPETLVESSYVMQATRNKSRFLLRVVPVTLYRPCG